VKANKTLLIVDDEVNILKSIRRLLIDTEFNVITAESAEKALEMFEKVEVHLVISDYRMPGMNGVEFLAKVKKKYPDTIRMILSGYADAMAIVETINDGQVYKFITKPWNDQELLTTIMRAFEQYNLLRENTELYAELSRSNKELQELTKKLEEKVEERTRDLEFKNRALMVAQNILNLLPVGVIGIDPTEMVVYMNDALRSYLSTERLALGFSARGAISDELLDKIMSSLINVEQVYSPLNERVSIFCIPLPNKAGVIGMLTLRNEDVAKAMITVTAP
jgi:two-component system NtrC family sensor kinase